MAFVKSGTGMFIPDGAADGQRPHSEPFMHALIEIKARIVANCFALGTEGKIYPSIDGTVQLGALNLVLVFRGAAGAAGSEREVSTVLIPSGLRIDFPHQSSKEAIDPETTSIRLEDTQCRRFIPEKGLRHARRAATHLEADVYLAAEIQAWFTAERCGDPRGPFIQIRGDLRLPFGLRARLMTGGGDGGPAHRARADRGRRPGALDLGAPDRRAAGSALPPAVPGPLRRNGVTHAAPLGLCRGTPLSFWSFRLRAPMSSSTLSREALWRMTK